MKKRQVIFGAIAVFILLAASLGNSVAFELITQDVIEKKVITEVDLVKTADNFIVFFDGSGSTNKKVPGTDMSQIAAAKMLLKERNQWLPDLGYNCGLYLMSGVTSLKTIQDIQPYKRDTFAAAIDQLPDEGKGNSLLQLAFFKLDKMLADLPGKTVVFLFTDGTYTKVSDPRKPVDLARTMAQKYNVAFYVISSAESNTQKELVKRVASINAASRVIPIQMFLAHPEYLSGSLFIPKVSSYVKLQPKTEVIGFKTQDVLFDFDSNTIHSEYKEKLDQLAEYLKNTPNAQVVLQGFSDNTGPEEVNLALSKQRAFMVSDYLEKAGIERDRIIIFWYGPVNAIGDNATKEGRQRNRRVEIAVAI